MLNIVQIQYRYCTDREKGRWKNEVNLEQPFEIADRPMLLNYSPVYKIKGRYSCLGYVPRIIRRKQKKQRGKFR